MESLSRFIDRRAPLEPQALCSAAAARFAAEPEAAALAVVEAGRVVGLLPRERLLALCGRAPQELARRSVASLMDPAPVVVDIGVSVSKFVDDMLASRPQAMGGGVIVIENGLYVGLAGTGALLAAKQARKTQARQASALIEELSVGIGQHLETLMGFAERLNRQSLPPDAQAWVRAITETSGELRDLTGFARELHWAQQERLVLRPAPCRLQDLADMVAARWTQAAGRPDSQVIVSYEGHPMAAALLDAHRVVQCFDALIHRALGATRGNVVEAAVRALPGERGLTLECAVRDESGALAGNPLQMAQDRSVDLAVRLRMALAARTLAVMGGVLRAGQTQGGGTTVAFQIEVTAVKADATPAPAALSIDERPVRVLVVDDNATNRIVAEGLCGLFGCVTESAADGIEALAAVRERPFDVILMDIRMPRLDGVEATKAIRRLPGPAGRTPIIALTANADPLDIKVYLQAGMQEAVEKPVKAEALARALDAVLTAAAAPLRATA